MIKVTTEFIHCKSCDSPYVDVEDVANLMFAICLECGFKFLLDIVDDYDS